MKRILLIIMLLALPTLAAIDAGTVFEVRTTGSQANGGGYANLDPGTSVDYTQQAAAALSLADFTTDGAGTGLGTATGGFTAAMVGNVVYLTGGTATPGWYQITAYTSTNLVTIDRTAGANKAGVTGGVGGAFLFGGALDDEFFEMASAGSKVWIEAGTYTGAEAMATAAGASAAKPIVYEGYNASRGDEPTGNNRPLFNLQSRWTACNYLWVLNLRVVSDSGAAAFWTWNSGFYNHYQNCYFKNTDLANYAGALKLNIGNSAVGCEFEAVYSTDSYGAGVYLAASSVVIGCYSHGCYMGFELDGGRAINCVGSNNALGCNFSGANAGAAGCTFVGNKTGINNGGSDNCVAVNNILAHNYTAGFATSGAKENTFLDYNVWYDNGTDIDAAHGDKGDNAVSADPLLQCTIVTGSDGATDGAGTAFTAASNPFGDVVAGDVLVVTEAGTGASLYQVEITAVPGAGEITLAGSIGASKTGIGYLIVTEPNFTPGTGSPALEAGADVSTYTTVTASVSDIGAIQAAAAASGGGSVFGGTVIK